MLETHVRINQRDFPFEKPVFLVERYFCIRGEPLSKSEDVSKIGMRV